MADFSIATKNIAAAEKRQLLTDPMPHLIVTPLHSICKICYANDTERKHSVTSTSPKYIRLHYKTHHQDQFELGKFNNISIRLAAAKLAATNGGWKEQLLRDDPSLVETHTICTNCYSGKVFGKLVPGM